LQNHRVIELSDTPKERSLRIARYPLADCLIR
jgi:hypothetical protein